MPLCIYCQLSIFPIPVANNINTTLYLLWAFINLALLSVFFYACFKAVKLVRQGVSMFAACVLAFGLLSFMVKPAKNDRSNESQWQVAKTDSLYNNTKAIRVVLQNNLISEYRLDIDYKRNEQNVITPVSAHAFIEGFVAGTYWKPVTIKLNTSSVPSRLVYTVVAVTDWKLLGATVSSQRKKFTGTVVVQ